MKNNLAQYCIYETETIINAIERIEQNNMRTIFVLNNSDKVVGVVSQGDILRAIIMGSNLYVQVNKIMTTSFAYLKKKDLNKAIELFKTKYFSLIPILSNDFKLKDVILFTDLINILEPQENVIKNRKNN
ncbi:MAG: CBS domain-containing protein [Smithella sp.]|jgi:CBS domain-containing protein